MQWRNPRNVQGSPLNAHRQQQRVAGNLRTVGKLQKPIRALRAETHRFLWREDLHTEAPRLRDGTPRQVQASESGRKPEIVLNSRTKPGLAAGGFALDDHRAQAFACPIHSGGKPRRAPAHDGEIVEIGLGMRAKANFIRDSRQRRLREARAIRKKDQRKLIGFGPE